MVLTGRLTKDAVINQLKDERQVVNFTVALNDFYKPKGESEGKQYTTYVECAYWISPKITERLKKGTVVEITGRPYVTAYVDMHGNAKGTLHCHVSAIKVHAAKGSAEDKKNPQPKRKKEETVSDDLPF
jgi:single-strand DNA-binding protein